MKTLTFGMLLACFSFIFSAFATADTSCAFDLNENLTLTHQLYRSLPDGVWTAETQNGQKAVLQFHPSGTADWFTSNAKGLSGYKDFTWAVIPISEEEARLELTANDHSESFTFEVEPACQSLKLSEPDRGFFLRLEHETAESKAVRSQKETLLAARWENTTYPFDLKSMEGAYLKYNFQKNGRFERMLGCASRNIKEAGDWWLAKDGLHLVMRLDNGETTVAEIKYLEMDEMVLKHVLNCEERDFATGDRDFFFNRQ